MSDAMNHFVAVLMVVALLTIGYMIGLQQVAKEATTRLQFDTVAAGVCTIEGGGKTFMVIDVTKEMNGEPTPEEVERPKNEEVKP